MEWQGDTIVDDHRGSRQITAQGGCVVITVDVLRNVVQATQDCRHSNSI